MNTGDHLAGDLVTVVIPARNEASFIGKCLESVLAQDHSYLQVIVVDGDSCDGTDEIVFRFAARDSRVELVRNPKRVIPVALNLAVAAARGRWLVRIDAHSIVPPDYVGILVEHLASGQWGGVGGRKDGVGVTAAGHAIAAAMSSRFGVGNSPYHYEKSVKVVEHVPFGAYPTDVVRALGGWNESLLGNQDYEFDYRLRRAGYRLLLDPSAVILWHCRQSVRELFHQYRRYGSYKAKVGFMHPRSLRVRQLLPSLLVLSWVAAGAFALRRPQLGAAAAAPYPLALAAASAKTASALEPGQRRWVPLAFAAMHIGWGIGFLESGIRLVLATFTHKPRSPLSTPPNPGRFSLSESVKFR